MEKKHRGGLTKGRALLILVLLIVGSGLGNVLATLTPQIDDTKVSMPNIYGNNFYLGDTFTNVTDILAYPQSDYSYTIWEDGGIYYAKNGTTGEVTNGVDASTLFQSCLTTAAVIKIAPDTTLPFGTVVNITVPVSIRGDVNSVISTTGDNEIFHIDLLLGGADSDYKVELKDLTFDGTNIVTHTNAVITFTHTNNVIRCVHLQNINIHNAQRGIIQDSTFVWYAMGSTFNNIKLQSMEGCSLLTACATDLKIDQLMIYNSFVMPVEPNLILNSTQGGLVYGSGMMLQDITVLGMTGIQDIDHSVVIFNRMVKIDGLIIDTTQGNALYLEGDHIYIDGFEIAAPVENGIYCEANWVSLSNGRVRGAGYHGIYLNGDYFQCNNLNFVDNGQDADDTYDGIYIESNKGANCVIKATLNEGSATRTRYAVYCGANSYGTLEITYTGQRTGGIYYNTSRTWREVGVGNGVDFGPSTVYWNAISHNALNSQHLNDSVAWTALDLTTHTSIKAKFAIIKVTVKANTLCNTTGHVVVGLRQSNNTDMEPIYMYCTRSALHEGEDTGGSVVNQYIIALSDSFEIDYSLDMNTDRVPNWDVDLTIYVLGYIE